MKHFELPVISGAADDEVPPQGTTPSEPAREPQNIREAIEMQQGNRPAMVEDTPPEPTGEPDDLSFVGDVAPITGETAPPAAPAVDPYAEFGGREAVERAAAIANAFETEQGLRYVAAQAATALGLDPVAVEALFKGQPGLAQQTAQELSAAGQTQADPFASLADDDMVTVADMRGLLTGFLEQNAATTREQALAEARQLTDPLLQTFKAQQEAVVDHALNTGLEAALGAVPADAAEQAAYGARASAVLTAADVYLEAGNSDPEHIRNAIMRGAADVEAQDELRFRAHVQRKRAEAEAQPTSIGGASSGSEAPVEPRNIKEAIAARKAAGIL